MTRTLIRSAEGLWRGDVAHAFTLDPAPEPSLTAGWRLAEGRLEIRADRLGAAPLYLGVRAGSVAVSTSASAAARALGAPLDADALAAFLRIGFLVGQDTLFAGVRSLAPGERLRIGPSGPPVQSDPGADEPPPAQSGLSREEVRDRFVALARDAVARRLPGPEARFGVPLSGGRDSRHILLQCRALGRSPDFAATHYAMPPQRDEDLRVARILAAAAGVEHRVSRIDFSRFWRDAARKNAELDHMTDEHHWFAPMAEALAPQLDVVMDGLGGDVLINCVFQRPDFVPLLRAGRLEDAAAAVLGPDKPLTWLRPDLRSRLGYDRARARLARALAPLAESPDPARETQFRFKMRREIALAPLKILAGRIGDVRLPFLDPALVAFARSLPHEEHGRPGLHDAVIATAFPDFAALGFEARGAGGRFDRAESRALLRDFLRLRRDWGKGGFENGAFMTARILRQRVVCDASEAFWWMSAWTHLRGLERTLEAMGGDLSTLAPDSRAAAS